VEKEKGIK